MAKFRYCLLLMICFQVLAVQPVRAQEPEILSFTSSQDTVAPDGEVTLSWKIQGASYMRLMWSHYTGQQFGELATRDLSASGTLVFPVSELALEAGYNDEIYAFFTLQAGNEPLPSSEMQSQSLKVFVDIDITIDYFTVTPTTIGPYETVTFAWSAPGASYVSLSLPIGMNERLRSETSHLPPTGTYSYTATPQDIRYSSMEYDRINRQAQYTTWFVYLWAHPEVRPDAAIRRLQFVGVHCGWNVAFWGSTAACPSSRFSNTSASRQQFENGFMLWVDTTNQILVLNNNSSWQSFVDTWTASDTTAITETAPPDRFIPVRGFGKVWANEHVRQSLDWATAEEQFYNMLYQDYQSCAVYSIPGGQAIFLNEQTATWAFDEAICTP